MRLRTTGVTQSDSTLSGSNAAEIKAADANLSQPKSRPCDSKV